MKTKTVPLSPVASEKIVAVLRKHDVKRVVAAEATVDTLLHVTTWCPPDVYHAVGAILQRHHPGARALNMDVDKGSTVEVLDDVGE